MNHTTEHKAESRHTSPYTTREKIGRMMWALIQATLFRGSFHTWYGWRRMLLRLFHAKVHPTVQIRRTVRTECPWNLSIGRNSSIGDHAIVYCLGSITIGDRVSISQYAHLCAGSHDYTRPDMPLLRPPITIGDDVWIATDAFVGPDVTVGQGTIVGARSSVFSDLPEWKICVGNPAKVIKERPH